MWKLTIFFTIMYLNCVSSRHLTKTQSDARTINQPWFINPFSKTNTTSTTASDQSMSVVSVSKTTTPTIVTTAASQPATAASQPATTANQSATAASPTTTAASQTTIPASRTTIPASQTQVEKLVVNTNFHGEKNSQNNNEHEHKDEIESAGLNNVNGTSDVGGGGNVDDFRKKGGDSVNEIKEIDGHRDEEIGGYQDDVIVDHINDGNQEIEMGGNQDEEIVEELGSYHNEEIVHTIGVYPDEETGGYQDNDEPEVGDLEIDHEIHNGKNTGGLAIETSVEVHHSEVAASTEHKDNIDIANHVSSTANTQANVHEQGNEEEPNVQFHNSIHGTSADQNNDTHNERSHTATGTDNLKANGHSDQTVHKVSEKSDERPVDSVNYVNEENNAVSKLTTTVAPSFIRETTTRDPDDVDPLDIFVDDIRYQRFPTPMEFETFKRKILDRPFKKLYILEEDDKKLFSHVRQLQALYTMEGDILYVSFVFRFIFSRKCQEIKRFRLGKHVGNTNKAYFEKELDGGVTERIIFFTEIPDDYVYFVSCTDRKTSPYACRDKYYVTLDSVHDPPNQFPWLIAAEELRRKMDLSFNDPRFVFNFVMMPCARISTE